MINYKPLQTLTISNSLPSCQYTSASLCLPERVPATSVRYNRMIATAYKTNNIYVYVSDACMHSIS